MAHHISETNYSADPKKMGFTYRHYSQNSNDNTTINRFDIKYDDIQFEWVTGNKASFSLDDNKRQIGKVIMLSSIFNYLY